MINNLKKIRAGQKAIVEIRKSGRTIVSVGQKSFAHIICQAGELKDFSHDLKIELVGKGAECMVTASFHGTAKNRHVFNVVLSHQALRTKGDVLVKAVYENESHGSFSGLIKIAKKGQKTDSYLRNDVLLLDKAMAVSKPTLEISNDDVKASHGSTTSNIDDNQLYYLQSRGLSTKQARQMIIEGFFHTVFTRICASKGVVK